MLTAMAPMKPRLRWYQFSLRTLLIFVSVVAIILAWYTHRYRLVEKQRQLTFTVKPCGGTVFYEDGHAEGYFLHQLLPLWYEAVCGPQQRILAVDVGNAKELKDDDIAAIRWLSIKYVFFDEQALDPITLERLRHGLPESEIVARKQRADEFHIRR